MSLLIVGATGTLGRQVARQALDEGYKVRCLVRSRQRAGFLKEWGAELVEGNLCKPQTLPPALEGVTAVIDASTARPNGSLSIRKVDWDGKVALIQAATQAGIERFVFFSILNAEKYPDVPLMEIKHCTEKFLAESGLTYTILRPCGFMQGLIGQYAIPILEGKAVWVMDDAAPIAYMNTQDIAKFAVKALSLPEAENRIFPMSGSRAWDTYEVIDVCERLSGQPAKVSQTPLRLVRAGRRIAQFFEWGYDLADRLAFVEVAASGQPLVAPMDDVYQTFKIESKDVTTLEEYLKDYFSRIMRKLKELDYQTDKATKKRTPF